MASLRTDDGKTIVVNLGRQDQVQQLDLREGNRITVVGRSGRINDRSAIIAKTIRANGETVDVRLAERPAPGNRSGSGRSR